MQRWDTKRQRVGEGMAREQQKEDNMSNVKGYALREKKRMRVMRGGRRRISRKRRHTKAGLKAVPASLRT
eukprot:6496937-Pyramimonas_sp.AAC.1